MRKLTGPVIDFLLAWQLLTSVPLPFSVPTSNRPAGYGAAYYPLVGLILGGLLALAAEAFYFLLPGSIAATLLLALWVALTGMLHLDGFMDSCDGLLPPRDRERRLEIMKDSRVGAFGVVGGVLLLLLKFNALAALPPATRWAALLAAPMLGRWAQQFAMRRYPLARPGGMGAFFMQGQSWLRVAISSVGVLVILGLLFGAAGLLLAAVTWLVTALVARFAVGRIGGLTGDVYGALCETVETVLLVMAAGLAAWGVV